MTGITHQGRVTISANLMAAAIKRSGNTTIASLSILTPCASWSREEETRRRYAGASRFTMTMPNRQPIG
jgi:hypothetical protein